MTRRLLLLCSFVGFLLTGCVHAPPTGAVPPVKHTVEAPDGWKLALHHYPVPDGAPLRARPVILCHGLGSNHHSLDLAEGASLARHLASQGFDVWALDLRGHGESRAAPEGKKRSKIDFDDYVRLDAPAAIEYVRSQTRSRGVAWVGHSMGGMIGFAHLGRGGEGVEALVTIASATTVKQSGLVYGVSNLSGWTAIFPAVHTRAIGRSSAAVMRGWWPFHLDNYVYNRENVTAEERRLLAGTALENLSRAETRQFRRWVKERTFVSKDGKDDYAANVARVEVPALLLSGSVDRIVPPSNVQHAMVRLGSSDKTHRVIGVSEGHPWDFGHVDIVAGRRAAKVVFPIVSEWLGTRDPTACAPLPSAQPVLLEPSDS